jgi:hypothetical protein
MTDDLILPYSDRRPTLADGLVLAVPYSGRRPYYPADALIYFILADGLILPYSGRRPYYPADRPYSTLFWPAD